MSPLSSDRDIIAAFEDEVAQWRQRASELEGDRRVLGEKLEKVEAALDAAEKALERISRHLVDSDLAPLSSLGQIRIAADRSLAALAALREPTRAAGEARWRIGSSPVPS